MTQNIEIEYKEIEVEGIIRDVYVKHYEPNEDEGDFMDYVTVIDGAYYNLIGYSGDLIYSELSEEEFEFWATH